MQSSQVRDKFTDFFRAADHRIVRSASLVPQSDPTLYFTNAGMVQFKEVFAGREQRDYRRACTVQKCLRVSGKHNDLESVGRTSRHHTFFEMLGNFSFGDYFKEQAIAYAWRFLTEEVGLAEDRLTATVFEGDSEVPPDEEAERIWLQSVGLPPQRVQRLGRHDNFWAMGEHGPCGPCSEVHYFQGEHIPCAADECAGVACECDRWVEIWNLVFIQFDRRESGELAPLDAPGVDTGMGFERLVAILQGVPSTYDTDLIKPLIELTAERCGKRYGENADDDISLRVVADHARATAFCIADGVFPEKGGREYVLRRIMRRAIRHGRRLGFDQPFFAGVCSRVVDLMSGAYPELRERREIIEKLAHAEEQGFLRTLDRGLLKLQQSIAEAQRGGQQALSDAFVGDLFATDGFPIDLTRLIAEEAGIAVDEQAAQDWVARTHGAVDSKVGERGVAAIYQRLADELGATEFLGHVRAESETEVLAILELSGNEDTAPRQLEVANEGKDVEVVTRSSPFYARGGGQVGDAGAIVGPAGRVRVLDTLKPDGLLWVHRGKVEEGKLQVGDAVSMRIDRLRRRAIERNHSATHLLHRALRQQLGAHVAQKGSEVGPERLRFDFSHFEAVDRCCVRAIEQQVNQEIRDNTATRIETMPLEQARQRGAMALFGEKYGDEVRVVRIGEHSIELCGGTHVRRSGDIGLFRISSEEPLALGVRRIVATTGAAALNSDQLIEQQLAEVSAVLRSSPAEAADRVRRLLEQSKTQQREIEQLKQRLAVGGGASAAADITAVGSLRVISRRIDNMDAKTLRGAGDALRDQLGSGVVILGGANQGKATLLVMVSRDLTGTVHAGDLIKKVAGIVGGRGGGRPDMAQAGGDCVEKIDAALQQAVNLLSTKNE